MPGPIVHLIVQQRLRGSLQKAGEQGKRFAGLLGGGCSPYAAFGSMGPDFLFFSTREYGKAIGDLTNFIFGVYAALEPLIDFYRDNIEPIKDDVETAITNVDQSLFNGLFTQLKQTSDLITSTAITAVAAVVTSQVDLFYPFYPKIQQGAPENKWYWFDFLHYRRTGRFCSELWNLAGNDVDLQRYALGYATHIATDVVGHPYVNAVTGGPYRMHWHRHKLVENWIDAYARNHYPDLTSTLKCLNIGAGDKFVPNGIAGSYYYRLVRFPGDKLPAKLSAVFAKALTNIYQGIPRPPMLNAADVDSAYRLWLKWFTRATSVGDALPPTPVPPPGSATIGLINDYVSGIPGIPGGGIPGGGGFSVFGILAALLGFAAWLALVLAYTFDWILNHWWDIVTLPYDEAIALMKWLLYQIQKAVWEIYDHLRFSLVLQAYIFPEPRDLSKQPWGSALLNTQFAHLTGGAVADFKRYPRKQVPHGLVGTTEHHLVYPGSQQEMRHAEPAPVPFHGVFPNAFITGSFPFDPAIENLYACVGPYGNNIQFTHYIDQNSWNTGQLGNALTFSTRLITNYINSLPDFNLDGDRGYGWKTWQARDPRNIEANARVDVSYV